MVVNPVLALSSGELSLEKYVEDLGSELSNPDVAVRVQGLEKLSGTLLELGSHFLSEKQCTHLATFYCSRMKDHHMLVPPSLAGTLALLKQVNLSSADAIKLLQTLFHEVPCQSQTPSDRCQYYSIFRQAVTTKLNGMKEMGTSFVLGFVQAMDGEREPGCLLCAFSVFPVVAASIDAKELTEDLFEVVACYFPVDFTPAASDKYAITREDLSKALESCLSSTSSFSPYCIPLILERLSSDLNQARLDAVSLLNACCQRYSNQDLWGHGEEIWLILQKILFTSPDGDLTEATLAMVPALIKALCRSPLEGNPSPIFDKILSEWRKHISDPGRRLMQPAFRLLQAVLEGSHLAQECLVPHALPETLACLETAGSHLQTPFLLEMFAKLITYLPGMPLMETEFPSKAYSFLLLCLQKKPDIGAAALKALKELITCLNDVQTIGTLAEHISMMLQTENSNIMIEEVCACLEKIAQKNVKCINDIILPSLMTQLQLTSGDGAEGTKLGKLLAACCMEKDPAKMAFPILSSNVCSSIMHLSECGTSMSLCSHLLAVMEDMCLSLADSNTSQLLSDFDVMECILSSFFAICEKQIPKEEVLVKGGDCIRACMLLYPSGKLEIMLSGLVSLILEGHSNGSLSWLNEGSSNVFPLKSSEQALAVLLVMEPLLCHSLLIKILKSVEQFNNLVDIICQLSFTSSVSLLENPSPRILACILNKSPADYLQRALTVVESKAKDGMNSCETLDRRKKSLNLWCWTTVAISLRSHGEASSQWLSQLIEVLDDRELGSEAAGKFSLFRNIRTKYLNQENGAIVSPLHKQRIFVTVLPHLVSGVQERQSLNHLSALSCLIEGVPSQVITQHREQVTSCLVQALKMLPEGDTLLCLNALGLILGDSAEAILPYISDTVPLLLKLASFLPSMQVRMGALKCLHSITSLETLETLQLKSQVLKDLAPCLDDKKRLVRREAANARCRWFLLGFPSSKAPS